MPTSLMSGRTTRKPLTELKLTNVQQRSTILGAEPSKPGKLSAVIAGPSRLYGQGSKRPTTAQPKRDTSGVHPLSGSLRVQRISDATTSMAASVTTKSKQSDGVDQLVVEGTGAAILDDHRLSTELMRILEERSMQPTLKVSPHKEAAERASEECPRRPVNRVSDDACKATTATAKMSSVNRITPCAPSQPKASSHARRTVKSSKRVGQLSRPRTAGPKTRSAVLNAEHVPRCVDTGHVEQGRQSSTDLVLPSKNPAQADCNLRAEARSEPQSRETCSSREDSAERRFNRPASACARASKESASARSSKQGVASVDSGPAIDGKARSARAGEGDEDRKKPSGVKSKSTIAMLIERFRKCPPQRPEDRKAAQAGSSSFWWRKNNGGKLAAGAPEQDVHVTVNTHVSGAKSGGNGTAGSTGRSSSPVPDCGEDLSTVRSASSDSLRHSHEPTARSRTSVDSQGSWAHEVRESRTPVTCSASSLYDSDAEQSSVRLSRVSMQEESNASKSARASLDVGSSVGSLDARTSMILRQASSAMDSTTDRSLDSATATHTLASSPPSMLHAQLDEAEDLLEQWRSERCSRQKASARASDSRLTAPKSSFASGRDCSADRAQQAEASTDAEGRHGVAGGGDGYVDSAVSRIRRRLGLGGGGISEGSFEPSVYARRMREMTGRLSSGSESEAPLPRKHAGSKDAEEASWTSDPLSHWREEARGQTSKRGSISRVNQRDSAWGASQESDCDSRIGVRPSARGALNPVHCGGRRDAVDKSQSLEYDDSKDLSFESKVSVSPKSHRNPHNRTPRSSVCSVVSVASELSLSPSTPPRVPSGSSMSAKPESGAANCGVPERRGGHPRSPLAGRQSLKSPLGGLSPRISAGERARFAEAVEVVVDNILFSAAGKNAIDSFFLPVQVQQGAPNTGSPTLHCDTAASGRGGGNRVSWDAGARQDEVKHEETVAGSRETRYTDPDWHGKEDPDEPFHFREVGFARWDSREEESSWPMRGEHERERLNASGSNRLEQTHISVPGGDEFAEVRGSPWNRTGKSDEMPRWSHTVWSENLCKTTGANSSSLGQTRCTHNLSIAENVEGSTWHASTGQTEHNTSIAEVINSSLIDDLVDTSVVSDTAAPGAQACPLEACTSSTSGFSPWKKSHKASERLRARGGDGAAIDEDLCVLEDLDMADAETGEVFVDRGVGVRGGVSPKLYPPAHGCDENIEHDDDAKYEDDTIVRLLRQRMQQITTEIEALGD